MKCNNCYTSFDSRSETLLDYPCLGVKIDNVEIPSRIIVCKNCNIGKADPMLDEASLDAIYNHSLYWLDTTQKEISKKSFPTAFALADSRWNLIKKYIKDNTNIELLDIGAGLGCLGIIAQEDKKNSLSKYIAVDSDSGMLKNLSDYWSTNQIHSDLIATTDITKYNNSSDVIVLSHVLEHVYDPESFLKNALDMLKEDGILFIDVPNQDYLFKSNVFPHISFFSIESLTILLERLELEILDIDIWGRSYRNSPLNNKMKHFSYYKNYFFGQIFAKIFMFLGEKYHIRFYGWLFGSNLRSHDGTWIRCIVQRKVNDEKIDK